MSDKGHNSGDNNQQILERIAYLERAIDSYGEQLRALNDVVSQIQVANNHLGEQTDIINGQINILSDTVDELAQNKKHKPDPSNSENDIIVYQETFDEGRQAALLKTSYCASQKTIDEIFAKVNSDVYNQMQCARGLDSGSLADSLCEYRRILTQIVEENPELKFVSAHALSRLKKNGETSYCQIRHDVDADIVACLPMAKIEAELGIQSTYFLLHTASYFGNWTVDEKQHKAVYQRHESLASYYLQIQELGHEIAIHTDPLHLYQSLNVDGAGALCADIEWLRSRGINIKGSAPHNSPDQYGASNSAIFDGRPITHLERSGSFGVLKDNKWAPLAILDEKDLDLVYEADDINSPEHGMHVDYLSPTSKNKWWRVLKTPELMEWEEVRDERYDRYTSKMDFWKYELPDIYQSEDDFWLDSASVPKTFSQRAPKIIVLSIHPEHFGYRENEEAFPRI